MTETNDSVFESRETLFAGVPSALKALASLKITVVLFAMAIFLIFAGTLAQVDKGIWYVVEFYFRRGWIAGFTWIDLQLFFPRSWHVSGGFPFPCGWLIGAAMLLNLLAAHAIRFRVKATGRDLIAGCIVVLIGAAMTWMVIASGFDNDLGEKAMDPSWRILWQLIKGGGASLMLLAGCIFLFKKRAGIVLIHAGIILMMFGELLTGVSAQEAAMRLHEGHAANYATDNRSVELAVVDPSDEKFHDETVVPQSRLKRTQKIQHADLPFDITPVRFLVNSDLIDHPSEADLKDLNKNPATAGHGLKALVTKRAEVSGVKTDQGIDVPSAYLKLTDKKTGADLGTYLVTPYVTAQTLEVDDKTYDISLRFKRTYLMAEGSDVPFAIQLINFRHERYIGTDTPKDFSSFVRVQDESRGVDREVRIWMNNPMRYAGYIFYQASFDPTDEHVTVIQVVKNASWLVPYVSLMIVATGLIAHFGLTLTGYLRRTLS